MDFCVHCGNDKQQEELVKVNGEYICIDCLKKHYAKCPNCGEYVPKQYLYNISCWKCTSENNGFCL